MYLADISKHANSAQSRRRRLRKRGVTASGALIWSEEENGKCRELFPDYQALCRALPHRTILAIRHHCSELQLAKRLPIWTAQEQSRFRKMFTTASRKELLEAFPNRSSASLMHKGQKLNLSRPRAAYITTGDDLLDRLREECFKRKLSMQDLDLFANGGGYFKNKSWKGKRAKRYFNYGAIVRGIYALGGKLAIEWGEQ